MTPICHRLLIEAPATASRAAQVACRVVGALALIACAAQAGDWPTRPITAVVPYAAGGNTDTMARIASERLTAVLGQPVVEIFAAAKRRQPERGRRRGRLAGTGPRRARTAPADRR